MKSIRATFSNGVIKPLEKVDVSEDEEIIVTVKKKSEKAKKKSFLDVLDEIREAWKGSVDYDELKKNIYESRHINTRPIPKL